MIPSKTNDENWNKFVDLVSDYDHLIGSIYTCENEDYLFMGISYSENGDFNFMMVPFNNDCVDTLKMTALSCLHTPEAYGFQWKGKIG